MVRLMEISEINAVMKIWLEVNLEVHTAISPAYWESRLDDVKQAMENSNIYVILDRDVIVGFAGVSEGYYLAGIFIVKSHRNAGFGKIVLDFVKQHYAELTLDVYETNDRARKFYRREGFVDFENYVDEDSQLPSFTMVWPENI